MLKKLGNIVNFFISPLKIYGWFLLGFAGGVLLTFVFYKASLQRQESVRCFNRQIAKMTSLLNQSGWDIACDKISYSPIWAPKIVNIKNFKVYNIDGNSYKELNIPEVDIKSSFLGKEIRIIPSEGQVLTLGAEKHAVSIERTDISAGFAFNDGLKDFAADFSGIKIKGLADIESVRLASRKIAPLQINERAPFFENFLEINNIKLNGMIDYPLGQTIERLYVNADIIGTIKPEETFQSSIRNWLLNDGKIDVKEMVVNWAPLLMVGRGELTFNENIRPILRLKTSSKAFINLLDELHQKGYLENKGMFVVKILLNEKAFKADPEDEYLTLSTSIDIQEDGILVEKIKIKSF